MAVRLAALNKVTKIITGKMKFIVFQRVALVYISVNFILSLIIAGVFNIYAKWLVWWFSFGILTKSLDFL